MKTKRQISPQGEQTRDRIYEAAVRVVATQGIENASVTAICSRAKVSRGHLGYYLPKKKNLLLELVAYILRTGWAKFEGLEVARAYPAIPIEIETRIRRNFLFFSENPHYFQVFMLFFYRASYDRECRKMNTQIFENVIGAFTEAFIRAGKSRGSARNSAIRAYGSLFYEIQRLHIVEEFPSSSAEDRLETLLEGIASF